MEKQTHYIDSIFYQIEQTAKYCRCLSVQLFQKLELDVTFDEFIVLDTIDANESICQRELAKLILKDRASTGRLLNSLEEKGCVERFVDTKNNRLVRKMKLSEKGGKILVDTTEKIRDQFKNSFSEEIKSGHIMIFNSQELRTTTTKKRILHSMQDNDGISCVYIYIHKDCPSDEICLPIKF